MQTKIRESPALETLTVGRALKTPTSPEMQDRGYLTVRVPAPGEETRILNFWTCPYCQSTGNPALITTRDSVIIQIRELELTPENLDTLHYASAHIWFHIPWLEGVPYDDEAGAVRKLLAGPNGIPPKK